MIITTNIEKAFEKIVDNDFSKKNSKKNLSKRGMKWNFLNLINISFKRPVGDTYIGVRQ